MTRLMTRLLCRAPRLVRKALLPEPFISVNRRVVEDAVRRQQSVARGWPEDITLNLSNGCNMRCRICNIGELERRTTFARNTLSWAAFEGLSGLLLGATHVDFNGFIGESLLNPEFIRIARWFKSRGTRVCVSTNGLALSATCCDELVAIGFDHVNFSLHGATEETYGHLQSPHFHTVITNVRRLLEVRRRQETRLPNVTIMHAMNKVNIGTIQTMLDLTAEIGADLLNIYHYRDYGYRGIELDSEPERANMAIDRLYEYASRKKLEHLLPWERPYYRTEQVLPDDVADTAPETRCELPWRGLQMIGSCVHPHTYYLGVCSMLRLMRLDYEEHLETYGSVRTEALLNHPVVQFLRLTVNSKPGEPRNPLCRFCRSRWRNYLKNTDTVQSGRIKNERLKEFHEQFRRWRKSVPMIRGVTLMEEEDPEFLVVRDR